MKSRCHLSLYTALALSIATVLLTGCASIEKQLSDAIAYAGTLGNVEYERTGFWTDSELVIHVEEDNTRTVEYEARTKTPGGPKVRIRVENIPHKE